MSKEELTTARQIGTTPQNLNQKIKGNSLTKEEMEQIDSVLGGSWKANFIFADGTVIQQKGIAMKNYVDKYHMPPKQSLFLAKKKCDENVYCGMRM